MARCHSKFAAQKCLNYIANLKIHRSELTLAHTVTIWLAYEYNQVDTRYNLQGEQVPGISWAGPYKGLLARKPDIIFHSM